MTGPGRLKADMPRGGLDVGKVWGASQALGQGPAKQAFSIRGAQRKGVRLPPLTGPGLQKRTSINRSSRRHETELQFLKIRQETKATCQEKNGEEPYYWN